MRELYEGIDLVPPEILQVVVEELLDSGRELKPSLREMQRMCHAAMEAEAQVGWLSAW